MNWKEAYEKYIKDVFPRLRPSQQEILSQIDPNARLVVISAPTGVGKSLLGVIKGIAESGVYPSPDGIGPGGPHVYVVTPTKGLQDQYKDTLQRIYMRRNWSYMVLKGRQNYSCPLLGKGKTAAQCPVLNAWQGGRRFCPYKPRRYFNLEKVEVDDYVRTADGSYLVPPDRSWCPYWLDKYEALRSHFVVFNYHYFFQELFYVGDFPFPDVVIFDEVHTAFNVLDSILSLTVTPATLQRWGIEYHGFTRNPRQVINLLRSRMIARLEEIERILTRFEDSEEEPDPEELAYYYSYVRLYNEISEALVKIGFVDKYATYFYTVVKFKAGGVWIHTRPYPVFMAYVVNDILFPSYRDSDDYSGVMIAMSATPGTRAFWSIIAKNAGLFPNEFQYIDYQQSPFPVSNRMIFIPSDAPRVTERTMERELGSLYKNADHLEFFSVNRLFRSRILASQAFLIQRLYQMFGRVLVHTWNNKLAFLLFAALNELKVPVVFPRERPTEEIQEWAVSGEDSVLVTAAAKEGVDLAYERARVQVILKLPVPNQRDPYVSMIRSRFPEYHNYLIASALVQQAGRVVRARDDWGFTIIYDSMAREFINKHPTYFPRYFREALVTRLTTEQVLNYLASEAMNRMPAYSEGLV